MSNFEVELEALVNEWLKRGGDAKDMLDAIMREAERLKLRAER